MYYVYIPNQIKRATKKFPRPIQERIEEVLTLLETNPYLGSKMHGVMDEQRKIKISNYRIIYQIIESKIVIEILEIESRGNTSYDR
ncbi:MAG: type II toxin-antitoxin system mRNA interferase toxin, RelE/StbE family [Candidatus Paceibacterota bacterium]